jgi:hypothetical protein
LATASIYLAIIGWLPLVFGPGFRNTVLAQNLPVIIRVLLSLTWLGLLTSMTIATLLMPARPAGYRWGKYLEILAQWILTPVMAIFFSSLPAIDSQTRFMLGKYLTFRVTEKKAVT